MPSLFKKLANSYKNSVGIALSIFEPLTDVDRASISSYKKA
jgi:hypothetical protein